MTYEEIDRMRLSGEAISLDLTITLLSLEQENICINDLVPLRLATCSNSLPSAVDIPITDLSGIPIGSLCKSAGVSLNPSAFTLSQFVAYLIDSNPSSAAGEYIFKYDYVVLQKEHLDMYLEKMKHSAPIWGGFVHEDRQAALPPRVNATVTSIIAVPTICLPTSIHERLAMRSVASATPSERYLQLYHQLELLFDWVVVQNIRALSTDLLGVGRALSAYASGDLDRLTSLMTNHLTSTDTIVAVLEGMKEHEAEAENIFQKYSKAGNPFKENWAKWIECLRDGAPSETRMKLIKPLGVRDTDSHNRLIIRATAYFIYRVRCCIAHSKIGEYVLRDTDEEFVVQFGEPLLRAVLVELLSHHEIIKYADNRLVPELLPAL